MRRHLRRVAQGVLVLSLCPVLPLAAETPRAVLTLPVTGSFQGGGTFQGTVAINRFEARGDHAVAIGFVSGVLTRGNRTIGTAVAGEREWRVAVRSDGVVVANGRMSIQARPALIAFAPEGRYLPVQAESCQVLDVALGPITVDLLGVQVNLPAIALNINGQIGTPLGDLLCSATDLLATVAGVVNLLNSILGLVTGLLGGLLGGLGGAVPVP
jgi:hypothetical protein